MLLNQSMKLLSTMKNQYQSVTDDVMGQVKVAER